MVKIDPSMMSRRVREVYEERLIAVWKATAQELGEAMTKPMAKGGRMRVKTGFLRASLMASTSAMPSINPNSRPEEGGTYSFSESSIQEAIIGAQLGQTIYLGFTAAYARPREFHDGFVAGAALQFRSIVNKNVARAIKAFP